MIFTKHAMDRFNQRGFTKEQLETIFKNGEIRKKPGKSFEIYIDEKTRNNLHSYYKKKIQSLEKIKNKRILISEDGVVITMYN